MHEFSNERYGIDSYSSVYYVQILGAEDSVGESKSQSGWNEATTVLYGPERCSPLDGGSLPNAVVHCITSSVRLRSSRAFRPLHEFTRDDSV